MYFWRLFMAIVSVTSGPDAHPLCLSRPHRQGFYSPVSPRLKTHLLKTQLFRRCHPYVEEIPPHKRSLLYCSVTYYR